jgi:glycosyltransferase involved in cell wall biosynthesis
VPVVTTDVGIVREALGPLQSELILSQRSVPALKQALRRLAGRPELLTQLSRENLEQVRDWDWPVKAAAFARFFDEALARKRAR